MSDHWSSSAQGRAVLSQREWLQLCFNQCLWCSSEQEAGEEAEAVAGTYKAFEISDRDGVGELHDWIDDCSILQGLLCIKSLQAASARSVEISFPIEHIK